MGPVSWVKSLLPSRRVISVKKAAREHKIKIVSGAKCAASSTYCWQQSFPKEIPKKKGAFWSQ